MSEFLKRQTIKGISWSFVDNLAGSGVSFLVGLALSRLLTPEEFGVFGIILIFVAISNSIIDSGFSNALIRKQEVKNIDYNTVFVFNCIVGLLMYFILFVTSPAISLYFREPLLTSIIRVMGSVLVINSLAIIHKTILIKKLDFKTQMKVSVISSIISGILGLIMAFYHLGVWSLVGQLVSRQLLNTILLWIYIFWMPKWAFSITSFKELFGFGSKLLLSGLIDTLYRNAYYIVIGRYYNASSLGQYTRAEQFSSIFSSNLTSVVQKVSYPVLCSIQNDTTRLREGFQKIIKVTMIVTFASMFGLAAVAKPLLLLLIGSKWMEAVYYLQIICFSAMLYPLHAINLNILQVKGRSDLFLKLEIMKKILALFPIILGVLLGIEYMLWGSVLFSVVAFFQNSHYSSNLIIYSTKEQLKDILPSFLISVFVAICMWCITLIGLTNSITLLYQFFLGIILTLCIHEKLKLEEYLELKKIALLFFNKLICRTNKLQ